MRIPAVLALLGLGFATSLVTETVAAPRAGKKKLSPPACGAKILPLVEGNTWTYVYVAAPNPIMPDLVKLAPPQATRIVIKVVKLETNKGEATASLEEKVSYELKNPASDKPIAFTNTINSTITCSKGKFEVSPDSFFFAAEPGGIRELQFESVERSRDPSFKISNAGMLVDTPWREDIVAKFKRTPDKDANVALGSGKLELERSFTPEANQDLSTIGGSVYRQTSKLALVTTGRITLDAPYRPKEYKDQPVQKVELPANWLTRFWFVADVGVVQTLNMYAHMFQLESYELN